MGDLENNRNEDKNVDVKKDNPKQDIKNMQEIEDKSVSDERVLRLMADFDNYKKRTQVEMNSAKESGKAQLLKSLLNIMDEFELTLIVAQKSTDKTLARGIEMLYANFKEVLLKAGLSVVPTQNKYDPYVHEILMTQRDEREEGTIIDVIKKGYLFNNMLLRAAAVIVSSGNKGDNTDEKNIEKEEKKEK